MKITRSTRSIIEHYSSSFYISNEKSSSKKGCGTKMAGGIKIKRSDFSPPKFSLTPRVFCQIINHLLIILVFIVSVLLFNIQL